MLSKFYADVLPQTGYFCLFNKSTKQHIWAESHEELVDLTQRYSDREGIYFGTASYQSVANRKQPNVRALRALRLDIDVAKASDPDGSYPNKKEALAASIAFFKSTGLLPTYVIASGKGFHIYWCMDADCAPADWVPMAEGLQRRGVAAGLLIDSTCTIDTARILRPPGTIHHDDVRVSVLQHTGVIWNVADLRGRLVSDVTPSIVSAPAGKYDMSVNEDVRIQVVQRPPVSAYEVVKKCEALRYVASVGGDVQEPYWRAMLGLVKHTIEGEDLAHEWSSGHPDYDADQTQKKIDGWTAGPTTCVEFANHTKACESCAYRGTVRSPVLLVNPPLPAAPAIPETVAHQPAAVSPTAPTPLPPRVIPPPTERPWEGYMPPKFTVRARTPGPGYDMVYLMPGEDTEEGQPTEMPVPFASTVFWISHWADVQDDNVARVQAYKLNPSGSATAFMIDQDVLAMKNELIRYLGGQGIQLTNNRKAHMAVHDFARAAVQMITHSGKRIQIADHLGLRITERGELIATQGTHTIFPDGRIERSMIAKKLEQVADQFAIPLPHDGAHSDWKAEDVWPYIEERATRHVQFLQKYYGGSGMERFQLAIMMGLASPFMPFVTGEYQSGSVLPRGGLSISLFSRESARGKTTAVQAAILAFGKPASLTNDGGQLGATDNARVSRLALHGTLPNIMDEMGSASSESVANAVHMVANGASRERGNREGGLNLSAPWALMNLITTNTSQRDMIAIVQGQSDAIQRRVLEINVEGMPDHNRDDRHAFARDWTEMNSQCVGALGAIIHREICKAGLAEVTSLTMGCVEKADKATGAKVADRFQYRGLGALLALHVTLAKIGIEIFPLKGVVDAFKVAHNSGRDFIAENVMSTDGLELLSRMLHDLAPHTLVTETDQRRVYGHREAAERALNERMPDVVHARHIRALGRTYLSVEASKAWCREHEACPKPRWSSAPAKSACSSCSRGRAGCPRRSSTSTRAWTTAPTPTSRCYSIDKRMLAQKLGHPDESGRGCRPCRSTPVSNVDPRLR